jgi:hypothetical protein
MRIYHIKGTIPTAGRRLMKLAAVVAYAGGIMTLSPLRVPAAKL